MTEECQSPHRRLRPGQSVHDAANTVATDIGNVRPMQLESAETARQTGKPDEIGTENNR